MRSPVLDIRPVGAQDATLAARLAFAHMAHPPLHDEGEMAAFLASEQSARWRQALRLVLLDGHPIGYVAQQGDTLMDIALPDPDLLPMLLQRMPPVRQAVYDEPMVAAFARLGFQVVRRMQRYQGIIQPPQQAVAPGVRGVTRDDLDLLADLMHEAFSQAAPDAMARESARQLMALLFESTAPALESLSTCVETSPGRLDAAVLYLRFPNASMVTLSHIMARPGTHDGSAMMAPRVQAEAAKLGLRLRQAWVGAEEVRIRGLLARYGFVGVGPPRHQGWRA